MTIKETWKMFHLLETVVARDKEDLFSFVPSVHFIENCGGYELELHPRRIMWDKDMICLCAMAEKMCCSVEGRFWEGKIIIR